MIRLIYSSILIVTLISCTKSNENEVMLGNFPEDIELAQNSIVSSLTGYQNILPVDIKLASRTTSQERALTRSYLSSLFEQLSINPIEHSYWHPNSNPFADILVGPFRGTNIYGILPANVNTNQYVILGAHYDTARGCPGANDNASAIALLYGVAKKLLGVKKRNVNVLIVFFDQEEEDVIGSKAFSKMLKNKGHDILSVHTFDQTGWDEDGDRAIELELPTEELKELYQKHGNKFNIPVHVTNVNSTDHHSFREIGFNSVGITEEYVNGDTSPFKDTVEDTFDTVNFEYVLSTTNLVYEVIKEIITKAPGSREST